MASDNHLLFLKSLLLLSELIQPTEKNKNGRQKDDHTPSWLTIMASLHHLSIPIPNFNEKGKWLSEIQSEGKPKDMMGSEYEIYTFNL